MSEDQPEEITQPTQQNVQNMEVHKHPHNVTHKKKWFEYLLEFFMIFFAVFLGFIAENVRENIVEGKREKEYIRTLVEDLKSDTVQLSNLLKFRGLYEKRMDSLQLIIENHQVKEQGNNLYFYAREVLRMVTFISYDRTIKQLKNSGNLRLIRNKQVSDSIMSYDQAVQILNSAENYEQDLLKNYEFQLGTLYNTSVFEELFENRLSNNINKRPTNNPQLSNEDPKQLQDHYTRVHFIKHSSIHISGLLKSLKRKAVNLINILNKKYALN
jgi:hypothetical protein